MVAQCLKQCLKNSGHEEASRTEQKEEEGFHGWKILSACHGNEKLPHLFGNLVIYNSSEMEWMAIQPHALDVSSPGRNANELLKAGTKSWNKHEENVCFVVLVWTWLVCTTDLLFSWTKVTSERRNAFLVISQRSSLLQVLICFFLFMFLALLGSIYIEVL